MAAPAPADFPAATPVRERIHALDVVRGFALAGILFANVLIFFGIFLLSPEQLAALPTAERDAVAHFLEQVFIEGKFYSVFSLLFGIGFGMQLARGGAAALPRFKRRLRILLAIGAIHAVLIWAGDILMLYALLGFTLPWFARKPDRELLRWAIALLATPAAIYFLTVAASIVTGGAESPASSSDSGLPPRIMEIFRAWGTGGLKDAFLGNLVLLAGRWIDLFTSVRFPKVLGMFVLGLWLVRTGIALAPPLHRATFVRWSALGWSVGLPANVIAAWALHKWDYLPPSPGGLLGAVMQGIGLPVLAIGYAATVTLLVVDGARGIGVFAPVGRMALTNYLMQSVICVVLSYGFGFGLWWHIGASTAMAVAAAIVLVQIPLSALWFSRFRFGPVEWIWRRLTYGRHGLNA